MTTSSTTSRISPSVFRSHVTRLLATEQAYTHNLTVLVTAYVKPMRLRANELAVLPGTLAQLFSNTEQLLQMHSKLLKRVRRARTARQLAAHFVQVAKEFEAYAVYVSNFTTAIATLHDASPRVQAALADCEADANTEVRQIVYYYFLHFISHSHAHSLLIVRGVCVTSIFTSQNKNKKLLEFFQLPLAMLMSAPLNRVADYVVALDQLVECAQAHIDPTALAALTAAANNGTAADDDEESVPALDLDDNDDDDDDDSDDDSDEDDDDDDETESTEDTARSVDRPTLRALLSAMAVLKQTHEYIQLKVDGSQHQTAVRAVRLRVPGKETLNLVTPKRKLVDEGIIYVYEEGKGRLRHFFIFNDLLLLAKSDVKRRSFITPNAAAASSAASAANSFSNSQSDRVVSSSGNTPLSALGDMLDRPSPTSPRITSPRIASPRADSSGNLSAAINGNLRKSASGASNSGGSDTASPTTSPRNVPPSKSSWAWRHRSSLPTGGGTVRHKTRASTLSASDHAIGGKSGPPLRHKLTLALNDRRFSLKNYSGPAPKGSPLQQWVLQNDTVGVGASEPIIFYGVDDDDGAARLAHALGNILSEQFTVFGSSLEVVLAEERKRGSTRNVPYAVDALTTLLRQRYIKTQGLFRVSGSTQVAVELQQRITEVVINGTFDARFDEVEPADLASTLKKYVRMLPEPLFPHDSYEAVLKLGSTGAIARKVGLRREVARLPTHNLDLVRHLVLFLGDVASHADENMMTVENIAIVFGPSFLQPQLESFDYAFQVPMVNAIVADLIRYRDTILIGDAAALSLKSPSLGSHRNAMKEAKENAAAAAASTASTAATSSAPTTPVKNGAKPADKRAASTSSTKKNRSRIVYQTNNNSNGIKASPSKGSRTAASEDSSSGADRPDTGLVRNKSATNKPAAAKTILSPRERAFLYGRDDQFGSSSSSAMTSPRDESDDDDDGRDEAAKMAQQLAKHSFAPADDDERFSSVFKVDPGLGFDSLSTSTNSVDQQLDPSPAPPPLTELRTSPLRHSSHRRSSSARHVGGSGADSPQFLSPRSPGVTPRNNGESLTPRSSARRSSSGRRKNKPSGGDNRTLPPAAAGADKKGNRKR